MEKVPKKTSTMSVTISSCSRESPALSVTSPSTTSTLLQRHSSLVQPLCISPQTVQKSNQIKGKVGASPSYVKVLHDVSTVKGQLVVLECRIRGAPPLQISWYREDKEITDSADFRILRKNQEEIIGEQVEPSSESSYGFEQDEPPLYPQDSLIPPPEWPDSFEEDIATPKARGVKSAIKKVNLQPDVETQPFTSSQVSEDSEGTSMNKLDPPPKGVKNNVPHPFLPTSKMSKVVEPRPSGTNMADLPTFSTSLYPPSAFNYERPRHFIQSMSSVHPPDCTKPNNLSCPATAPAPSESHPQPASTSTPVCSSMTFISKAQSNQHCEKLSPADFLSSVLPSLPSTQSKCISKPQSLSPRRSPCPSPKIQEPLPDSKSHKTAPPPNQSQNHAFSSVGPWIPPDSPPSRQLPPASHVTCKPATLPRPILKKTVSRPVSRTTDEDIQGSKDALIQEIEQKLRNKAPQTKHYQVEKKKYKSGQYRDFNNTREVAGLPTPDISWYLDGKPIRPDDYHKMLVCEKSVHSFIIEIVTIHHAGVYECIAKNRAGESRFSLKLDVIAQEQLYPPTFVVKMRNSRTLEGDAIRLECKVNASPTPQVYWKKDKEMLRIDPTRMSGQGLHTFSFLFHCVFEKLTGWYTVSAINEAGMSTCNARLDVATRLNKISPPARPFKGLPIVSQFSTLCVEPLSHSEHSAPLYESAVDGQDTFMENYFTSQRDNIFRNVEVLIYVFDVESRELEKDMHYYQSCLEAILQNSPDAKVFCLVHKMDLVQEDQRDLAWSSIVYQLIPNVQQLECNLRNFAQIIEADEVLLFERATFLVISHYQCKEQRDAHRFEKISNIIKQFKLSCSKLAASFQSMEVRNSNFAAFIDVFTSNTYVMGPHRNYYLIPGEKRMNTVK
ncbi:hypothetical protein DNTS_020423 [Danionella cerebrum]|uniref:Ig-like domain-containing protein n=1 Tax=Danionella cerebrum TaxID=2873325 RepID=A0A553QMC1_9TELE|nr:hypothetical protein DNTS_020423 [Danionella translucida]